MNLYYDLGWSKTKEFDHLQKHRISNTSVKKKFCLCQDWADKVNNQKQAAFSVRERGEFGSKCEVRWSFLPKSRQLVGSSFYLNLIIIIWGMVSLSSKARGTWRLLKKSLKKMKRLIINSFCRKIIFSFNLIKTLVNSDNSK